VTTALFHLTTEEGTKPLPFTVKVNAAAPAVAPIGDIDDNVGTGFELSIVNVAGADVPPPGAPVCTATVALPTFARSCTDTSAVSSVVLTYVVLRSEPFHLTTDEVTNPLPTTVRVMDELPAVALVGEIEERTGEALSSTTSNDAEFDVPPPGAGVNIVMLAEPDCVTFCAATTAVIFVSLT